MTAFPSTYYHHGGVPRSYVYDWRGGAMQGNRAAETRALGADFLDISARFHKELSGYYPVVLTEATGRGSVRHSGMEQTWIDDGMAGIGLSKSEKSAVMLGALALGGYLAWKHLRSKR